RREPRLEVLALHRQQGRALDQLLLRGGQVVGAAEVDLQRPHQLLAPRGRPGAAVEVLQAEERDVAELGEARLERDAAAVLGAVAGGQSRRAYVGSIWRHPGGPIRLSRP